MGALRIARNVLSVTVLVVTAISVAQLSPVLAAPAAHLTERSATAVATDWPSIDHDAANTSHDAAEVPLTSSSLPTLHPIVTGPDRGAPGPLLIVGNHVFGTCPTTGGANTVGVCAYSRSTLALQWHVSISGGGGDETNLAASAGVLVAHADGFPSLYGLNEDTGAQLWRATEPDESDETFGPPFTVYASTFVYFDSSGRVVTRSLASGAELSRVTPGDMAPTAANNRVLAEISGDVVIKNTVYSLTDARENVTATPLTCAAEPCPPMWSVPAPQYAQHITYASGRLFLDGDGPDGITAYNAATGAVEFGLTYPDAPGEGAFEYLEAARNVLLASDQDGTISAWPTSGCGHAVCNPVWQVQPAPVEDRESVFAEANGRLYTAGSHIYAVTADAPSPYGPPAAPTKVTAVDSTSCSGYLTWTPPTRTGSLALTGSTVRLSDGTTQIGYATSAHLPAVPPGTYTATVAETTAWGAGTYSTPSARFNIPANCD